MKRYNYFFGLLLLLLFLYFTFNFVKEKGYFINLTYQVIVYILLLKTISLIVNAIFNIEILKVFDINLDLKEGLYLSSVTFLGNLFLPGRSGGAIRLIYLNKIYKLKKEALISQFSYFFVISIFVNTFFLIICILALWEDESLKSLLFAISVIILFLIAAFLLFKGLKINSNKKNNKFFQIINKTKSDWQRIISESKIQKKLLFLTLFNFSIFYIETVVVLSNLFGEKNIFYLLFFNSSSLVGSLIGLTPGSLGLKEAFIIFSSDFINFGIDKILSFSVVDRGASLLFSIIPLIIILNFIRNRQR